jgi:hypothetical protein
MRKCVLTKYQIMRGMFKRLWVRRLAASLIAFFNKGKVRGFCEQQSARGAESFTRFNEFSIDRAVSELNADGATVGPSLPDALVRKLRDAADRLPCFAGRDPQKGFFLHDLKRAQQQVDQPILLAQYLTAGNEPEIKCLSEDPFLLSLAAKYLGVPPKLLGINMWWTFPVDASPEEKSKHAHVFHYDLDDIKFVKFFFYLTDVDSDAGPHVYVKTSNRDIRYKNSLIKSKRFTDEEIAGAYGDKNIIEVVGAAGTCLIEDTITIHKGVTPISKPRLLLQFEYSINTYPQFSQAAHASNQLAFL